MDPGTILSVIGAASSATQGALALWAFLNDAKDFDSTAAAFADEIKALGAACEVIGNSVESIYQKYKDEKNADITSVVPSPNLWPCLDDQLKSCQRTIENMRTVMSDFIGASRGARFWVKVQKQFALNLKSKEITEARERVKSHTTGLQLVMHSIVIQISYLIPQRIDQRLQPRLAALTNLKETFAEARAKKDVAGENQTEDAILKATGQILHDGATFYESSIAGGSLPGARDPLKMTEIHRWLSLTDEIDQDRTTDPSVETRSIFSVNNPPESSVTDDDDLGAGVSDRNKTGENDSEDDFDDNVDLAQDGIEYGRAAFEKHNYPEAIIYLQEALQIVSELPARKRRFCNTDDMRYMLAHCAYHTEHASSARDALVDVIDRLSLSSSEDEQQKLRLCETSDLLAQTCIKLGKLDEARLACQNAMNLRRRLLGKQHDSVYESFVLMARILKLQGHDTRARLYLDRIPATQAEIAKRFDGRHVETSNDSANEETSSQRSAVPPQYDASSGGGTGLRKLSVRLGAETTQTRPSPQTEVQGNPPSQPEAALIGLESQSTADTEYVHEYEFYDGNFRHWAETHHYMPKGAVARGLRREKADQCFLEAKSQIDKLLLDGQDDQAFELCIKLPEKPPFYRLGSSYLYNELSHAVLFGLPKIIDCLILKHAALTDRHHRFNVFWMAAVGGSIQVAELLIARMAKPDLADLLGAIVKNSSDTFTDPIMQAIECGNMDICDLYIHHGFKGSAMAPHVACTFAPDAIPYLQALSSVDRLACSNEQFSLDTLRAMTGRNLAVDKGTASVELVRPGDSQWKIIIDVIGFAILRGSVNVVKWALSVGATRLGPYSLVARNNRTIGISAVELAAAGGHMNMVKFLLGIAPLASRESLGTKALKMAVINLRPLTIHALSDAGYRLELHVKQWASLQHEIATILYKVDI